MVWWSRASWTSTSVAESGWPYLYGSRLIDVFDSFLFCHAYNCWNVVRSFVRFLNISKSYGSKWKANQTTFPFLLDNGERRERVVATAGSFYSQHTKPAWFLTSTWVSTLCTCQELEVIQERIRRPHWNRPMSLNKCRRRRSSRLCDKNGNKIDRHLPVVGAGLKTLSQSRLTLSRVKPSVCFRFAFIVDDVVYRAHSAISSSCPHSDRMLFKDEKGGRWTHGGSPWMSSSLVESNAAFCICACWLWLPCENDIVLIIFLRNIIVRFCFSDITRLQDEHLVFILFCRLKSLYPNLESLYFRKNSSHDSSFT